MTKLNKSKEDDSKSQIDFYFSRTSSVETQENKLQMGCPQAGKWWIRKSFWRKNGHHTDEPCFCCSEYGLA